MTFFAEFVSTTLAAACGPASHRYLILDASATRPVDFVRALALKGQAIDLLTRKPCTWRECASPVLIRLPTEAASVAICRRARELMNDWRYANCFLYVESPHAPDVAVRLFAERTDAVLPQDMSVVLRYFDSRIFGTLMRVLDDWQLRAFLAAGTRWALPGRTGELLLLDHGNDPEAPVFTAPLVLGTAQEAALIDAAETDAMVDLLLNQNNSVLLNLLPPQQFERIGQALARANGLGLRELGDQVAYCSLDLDLGPAFIHDSPWVEGLGSVKEGRMSLSALIEQAARGASA